MPYFVIAVLQFLMLGLFCVAVNDFKCKADSLTEDEVEDPLQKGFESPANSGNQMTPVVYARVTNNQPRRQSTDKIFTGNSHETFVFNFQVCDVLAAVDSTSKALFLCEGVARRENQCLS
uniref:Uncharacterized protein n=1 Tax=Lotharella oceanica TaxID=641309 RepID=A0A7S2TNW5_9EUKA|mmetsp:Transcript_20492/g.38534  ORF Transcript_20492/g.38534 Transcript_20492/m.38534 type:complete len:120 (+) Transcript_20492:170-529(+)